MSDVNALEAKALRSVGRSRMDWSACVEAKDAIRAVAAQARRADQLEAALREIANSRVASPYGVRLDAAQSRKIARKALGVGS